MAIDTSKYREQARIVFGKLKKAIENPNNDPNTGKGTTNEMSYWRMGCSFDTMTDYLLLIKDSTSKEDITLYNDYKSSLQTQLKNTTNWETRVDPYGQYLKTMIKFCASCCYDDFAWWGIVSSKAYPKSPYYNLFLDLFGSEGVQTFQNMATQIWEVVNNGNYEAVFSTIPDDYPGFDEEFKTKFLARKTYHGGSPNVWKRITEDKPIGVKDYFDAPSGSSYVEPRYPNGMWQYDYYWDPVNKTDSYKDGTPKECCAQNGDPKNTNFRIGPFQNTLMSGLVLVYASRLHSWQSNTIQSDYLSVAKGVKEFLDNWFTLKGVSGKTANDQLLWHYDDDINGTKVLARERVGSYAPKKGAGGKLEEMKVRGYWASDKAETDGHPIPNPDVPSNRVWTGDQGLLLGGLVAYETANGKPEEISELITNLITSTLDVDGKLFYPKGASSGGSLQHLQPYEPWGSYANLFCLRDYWSGAGVFWRYLLQTYKTSDTVKKAVDAILSTKNNAIIQSANAAPTPSWPWAEGTSPLKDEVGELFLWFSPMATLTAAIYILENSDTK